MPDLTQIPARIGLVYWQRVCLLPEHTIFIVTNIATTNSASVSLGRSLIARVVFTCAAALTALWLCASLWFPFGWDQGFFASVGDVIVRGGMPYRDGWEMKGPLTYYAFAFAQWLFGRHMWSIRIFDLPLLIAGMAALAAVVGRFTSRMVGWWAAIVFALWIGSLTWFHAAQPDGWVASFMILAAAPLVARKPSATQLAFCGVLIGCATLVKPLYLGFLAAPLMYIAGQPRPERGSKLALAASVSMAALIPPLLAVAWFAYRGALRDLVDVHLLYTMRVYSGSSSARIREMIAGVLRYFLAGTVTLALPVIVIGAHALWRASRSSALLVITWAMVAVACVAAQGKFYKYHWMPLFPPLVILGAVGCYTLLMAMSEKTVGKSAESLKLLCAVSLSLTAFVVLQLSVVPATSVAEWLELVAGRIGSDRYYASHAAGGYIAGDDMKAARYIRERTQPTDGVAVWGNNALIGFLSGRPNPTRFVYAMPLTEGGPRSPRDTYRREYMSALLKNPPAYFVVGVPWGSPHKDQVLHDFPELETLLHERYSMETQVGGLDLYHRN